MQKWDTWIVRFWENVFEVASKLSLFSLVRECILPKNSFLRKSYGFVDAWVFGHLILSFMAIIIVDHTNCSFFAYIFCIYGLLRVFEIFIYQANVTFFDDYRNRVDGKAYYLRGYRRMVILLVHNYFEILFWFACIYIGLQDMFVFAVEESRDNVFGSIHSSFWVMTTFGFENVTPIGVIAYSILIFQSFVGLFMTLISIARFISYLPKPETIEVTEKESITKKDR